jgi:hypothetical protein
MANDRIRMRVLAETQRHANQVFALVGMVLALVTMALVVMIGARA